jgi:hypothetical protein
MPADLDKLDALYREATGNGDWGLDGVLTAALLNAYPDLDARLRAAEAVVEAAGQFVAVNVACPAASWKPESRTLRVCHCGFESLRAALAAYDAAAPAPNEVIE